MNQNLIFRSIQKGFTLVELLIVVIILSILAAIALPQFTASTDDANLASLNSTLGNMRSVIDLYAQQHNGAYPGDVIASGGTCDSGTAVSAAAGAVGANAFMAQLTRYTNAAGEACTGSGANYRFGPYLKKDTFPGNPITGVAIIEVITDGFLGMLGSAANQGWKYDSVTGQFIANDTSFIPPGANPGDPTYDTL